MHKKGSWMYPIDFMVYGTLLVIILVFYGILLFGFDLAESQATTVSIEDYQDSTTLINILKTPIKLNDQTITVLEAINLANKNQIDIPILNQEINNLLLKLPKPVNSQAYYKLEIKKQDKDFLEFGQSVVGFNNEYLKQEILIPIDTKETAIAYLTFICSSCSKEQIEVLV